VGRAGALLAAAWALAACTGTFTPAAPTLYLVVLDAGGGLPARVALLAFEATPTERRLDLLTPSAYAFAADEAPFAVDVRDRDDRTEAWVLTAVGTGRGVRLHRLDLRAVADAPGTTIAAAAPPRTLTDADGAWVGFGDATFPTGCLADLVVPADGASLALWDAGSDARCGEVAGAFPQVHVLDLVEDEVRATLLDAFAPGVAPAEPGDADGLLLVQRPVGSLDARQVTSVTFDAPRPDLGAPTTVVEGLLDVVGVPGGFATLRTNGGDRQVGVVVDGVATERAAPAGATALHADPTGRLANLLTTGGGRLGVTYPGEPTLRELAFDATDLTIEPLNAYALAVRPAGGLCLVDLLVASGAPTCDLSIDPALAAALPAPRFVTWTYAEPVAP
jgi:hypothetical protein